MSTIFCSPREKKRRRRRRWGWEGGNEGVINESLSLQGRSEDAMLRERLLLALEHMRNKVRLVGAADM